MKYAGLPGGYLMPDDGVNAIQHGEQEYEAMNKKVASAVEPLTARMDELELSQKQVKSEITEIKTEMGEVRTEVKSLKDEIRTRSWEP